MGHVQDLWYKAGADPETGKVVRAKTRLHGKGKRYRVRYTDPEGRERSKSFADRSKKEASEFLSSIEHDKRTGTYVDRRAGEMSFRDYAESWLATQTFDETSREVVGSRFNNQTYPYLGSRSLGSLGPTDVRAWQRRLQEKGLSDSYRKAIFVYVQAVLDSAVDDGKIRTNPCKASSVRKPRATTRRVKPWSAERVQAVQKLLPEPLRIAVDLGAGLGLRQGEALALAVGDIDYQNRVVHVTRGVRRLRGGLCYGPPKGGAPRDVPLPQSIADALSQHHASHPASPITLPWQSPKGRGLTARLILHNDRHQPVDRSTFNRAWRAAVQQATAGPADRGNGFHALRHFYASTLLDSGESIVAVSEYLGHADPGFTLRTYTHLMPDSEPRTRDVIDTALATRGTRDGVPTA